MNETTTLVMADAADVAVQFSPEFDKVAPALVQAQREMGEVRRNCTADAGKYVYRYADLAMVSEAVSPALLKHGIAILQGPATEYLQNGSVYVRVTTLLLHESTQWVRNVLTLRPERNDPQGIGSAVSYARRYALQSLCNVAAPDDDGKAASGAAEQPRRGRQRESQPPAQAEPAKALSEEHATINEAQIANVNAKLRKIKDEFGDDFLVTLIGEALEPLNEVRSRTGKVAIANGKDLAESEVGAFLTALEKGARAARDRAKGAAPTE